MRPESSLSELSVLQYCSTISLSGLIHIALSELFSELSQSFQCYSTVALLALNEAVLEEVKAAHLLSLLTRATSSACVPTQVHRTPQTLKEFFFLPEGRLGCLLRASKQLGNGLLAQRSRLRKRSRDCCCA